MVLWASWNYEFEDKLEFVYCCGITNFAHSHLLQVLPLLSTPQALPQPIRQYAAPIVWASLVTPQMRHALFQTLESQPYLRIPVRAKDEAKERSDELE